MVHGAPSKHLISASATSMHSLIIFVERVSDQALKKVPNVQFSLSLTLNASLFVCLFVFIRLSVYVCLSISVSVMVAVSLSHYISDRIFECLSICLYVSLCISLCLCRFVLASPRSVCLPACLPVCLPVSRAFPVSTMKINEGRLFRSQTTTDHAHNPTDRCTHIQKHTQPDLNGHQDISANHVLRVVHTSRVSLHSITNY